MRRIAIVAMVVVSVLLSGCNSAPKAASKGPNDAPLQASESPLPEGTLVAEAQEGDFVLQLVLEKDAYTTEEPVVLKARLKYVGEQAEVHISHAASPFLFLVKELTRDIDIGYVMAQPLIQKQLKQGEWLEETYTKNGGYGDSDPHKEFLKQFLNGKTFPDGKYSIAAMADLTLYDGKPDAPGTKETDFRFQTEPLLIEVK